MTGERILSASVVIAILVLAGNPLPAVADSTGSAQATSSIVLGEDHGAKTVEITNVTFETTGTYVPGRPADERLLLRTTARSRQVIDEKGLDASVSVEAWPLGSDVAAKPLYGVTLDGVGVTTEDSAVLVFDRGTEDVAWWSVHKLGTGEPLFDSHVPVRRFSLSRDVQTLRYVGFEVPPDDATDARLREPHVVGVLAYASAERVIRRLLVTCDNTERAALLRSYWDTTRALSVVYDGGAPEQPPKFLLLRWSPTAPVTPDSPVPAPDTASIPVADDDLDAAHAELPACIALAPWSP